MNDPHQALRQIPVFGGLSDQELDKVISLATTVEAPRGMLLVKEGDLAKEFFVIESGAMEVVVGLGGERECRLSRLGAGDCFGEMALIDIQRRSASVRALEDSVVLSLSNRALHLLSEWNLATYTLITLNLAREISRRLRRADAVVAEFARAAPRHSDEDSET